MAFGLQVSSTTLVLGAVTVVTVTAVGSAVAFIGSRSVNTSPNVAAYSTGDTSLDLAGAESSNLASRNAAASQNSAAICPANNCNVKAVPESPTTMLVTGLALGSVAMLKVLQKKDLFKANIK